jgi:signal peptidase I
LLVADERLLRYIRACPIVEVNAELNTEIPKPPQEIQAGWLRFIVGRKPKWTLIRLGIWIVLSVVLFKFILVPIRVTGISMEPTYHDGRINFVNRLAYKWSKPQRGDVVSIRTTGEHIMYMKRIIGLPGETISIRRGVVHINDEPLNEPYLHKPAKWRVPPRKLEANEYIVIGDNRTMDQDAHEFGVVTERRIVGKVIW